MAVHRTDAGVPVFTGDPADLAPEERGWLEDAAAWGAAEGAYAAMHRTKPQTAAFGLTDSPVGLAAWIVEKLRAWSGCGGDIERSFTKDEILGTITIYWLTGTIGSSMRMYAGNAAIPPEQLARRVEVPSGFSIFAGDVDRLPRAWLERTTNLVSFTEPPRGGHFAPFWNSLKSTLSGWPSSSGCTGPRWRFSPGRLRIGKSDNSKKPGRPGSRSPRRGCCAT